MLLYIGAGLASLVGAYILYLLIIAVVPGVTVPEQRFTGVVRAGETNWIRPVGSRHDVEFEVKGTPIRAWLYMPQKRSTPVPCIVMGHGLGGTKSVGLDAYAARFAQGGFAVVAFDFRYLGESGGEPRQLVWIPYQLEDYRAAIAYARHLEGIDPARIALWGTSLSGGHVIRIAAEDHEIACVSAQVPLLDGSAGGMKVVRRIGLWQIVRMTLFHGLRDLIRSYLRLSAHKVPLFGRPGTVAALADEHTWDIFNALAPPDFVNEVCARILIRMDKYRPIKYAGRVNCPVMLQVCDKDVGLPPTVIKKAKQRLGDLAKIIHYPIDHFDIYVGEHLERSVTDHVEFFMRHLVTGRSPASRGA